MRCESLNGRLRFAALYMLAAQRLDEVGMLAQDAALQGVTLLARHLAHVQRVMSEAQLERLHAGRVRIASLPDEELHALVKSLLAGEQEA